MRASDVADLLFNRLQEGLSDEDAKYKALGLAHNITKSFIEFFGDVEVNVRRVSPEEENTDRDPS
jgi:hypothetical protein